MYLLDTNILIYILKAKQNVLNFLGALSEDRFAISIISRLEFLDGLKDEIFLTKEVQDYLDLFENIVLDREIAQEAALLSFRVSNKVKFKDLIIAATAISTGKTLVTVDKDFKKFPGLNLKLLQLK